MAVAFSCVATCARAALIEGKVVAIKEGDVIVVRVKNRPIALRIYGIDCPELPQEFGEEAKDYTFRKCFNRDVTYRMRGMDKEGRTIAEVQLPKNSNLGWEILRSGFAWWDRENAPKQEVLGKLEEEARQAKRGLWAKPNPTSPWDWRQEKARKEHEAAAGPNRHRTKPKDRKKEPEKQGPPGTGKVDMVYISKRNRHYHRDSCRRLDEKKTKVFRVEATASGYSRCPVCRP